MSNRKGQLICNEREKKEILKSLYPNTKPKRTVNQQIQKEATLLVRVQSWPYSGAEIALNFVISSDLHYAKWYQTQF